MPSTGDSGASDFGIPQGILKALPSDPYDQLSVACKITSLALSTRVSELESESSALRADLAERDALISELRSRAGSLDASLAAAAYRLTAADIEKESLLKHNQSLYHTVQKLSRYVEKLEFLKKMLVESLQEDEPSFEGTPPQIIARPTPIEDDDSWPCSRSSSSESEFPEMGNRSAADQATEVPTPSILHGLLSERNSPEFTPVSSPPNFLAPVYPSQSSKLVYSRRHIMSLSNSGSIFDDRSSVHSLSSTPGSLSGMETQPQTGRSLAGGREFLRKARMRLSYEQFGEFLATVKDLNARTQNKEETLRKAAEIFGTENEDLYDIFLGLLTRSGRQSR